MKLAAFLLIGPLALFAYCWRHGTALGWYRDGGRLPPKESQ